MTQTITLTFNNTATSITSDANGLFNLNTLHKISGTAKARQPNEWKRNAQTKAFLAGITRPENPGLVVKRGGNASGSWGTEQVVYAYAMWVSPEFHAAVIEAFTQAVHGDGDAAVAMAQRVARTEGMAVRATEVFFKCGKSHN